MHACKTIGCETKKIKLDGKLMKAGFLAEVFFYKPLHHYLAALVTGSIVPTPGNGSNACKKLRNPRSHTL